MTHVTCANATIDVAARTFVFREYGVNADLRVREALAPEIDVYLIARAACVNAVTSAERQIAIIPLSQNHRDTASRARRQLSRAKQQLEDCDVQFFESFTTSIRNAYTDFGIQ